MVTDQLTRVLIVLTGTGPRVLYQAVNQRATSTTIAAAAQAAAKPKTNAPLARNRNCLSTRCAIAVLTCLLGRPRRPEKSAPGSVDPMRAAVAKVGSSPARP
jgi:hypothetical protein